MLVVFGSINADLVAGLGRVPGPGETLFADSYHTYPGGKGANQAVAAALLGADVRFWGMVGTDGPATAMREALSGAGVDIASVETAEGAATGTALILVEEDGQNRIVVVRGANFEVDESYVERHRAELSAGDLLLCQNEIPQPAVLEAFKAAKAVGAVTVLNPAPATQPAPGLLALTDMIIPNQTEAEALTGIACRDEKSAAEAALKLRELGPDISIITLGGTGVCVCKGNRTPVILPAHRVPVVDTTAAGDSFVGGLCAGIMAGLPLTEAAGLGQWAAAYSIGRPGAQPSMATLPQLRAFAKDRGAELPL